MAAHVVCGKHVLSTACNSRRFSKLTSAVVPPTFQHNRKGEQPKYFISINKTHVPRTTHFQIFASEDAADILDDLPLPELQFEDDEEMDELDNWNLLKILHSEMEDQDVNEVVWKCLGYEKKETAEGEDDIWEAKSCFPKWAAKYPTPPDVIGVTRIYLKEIDGPCLKANQALVRSIPQECKQDLKKVMKPYGFKGWKMDDLTPNKTRRAQVVNWLLYYRDHLRGKTMEQLIAEREERQKKGLQTVREKPLE